MDEFLVIHIMEIGVHYTAHATMGDDENRLHFAVVFGFEIIEEVIDSLRYIKITFAMGITFEEALTLGEIRLPFLSFPSMSP